MCKHRAVPDEAEGRQSIRLPGCGLVGEACSPGDVVVVLSLLSFCRAPAQRANDVVRSLRCW
jgi:hypothetical protein